VVAIGIGRKVKNDFRQKMVEKFELNILFGRGSSVPVGLLSGEKYFIDPEKDRTAGHLAVACGFMTEVQHAQDELESIAARNRRNGLIFT
jgi:hypothetical protein